MIRCAVVLLALLGSPPTPHHRDVDPAAFKVARELRISVAHHLGAAEAKRRVAARFALLQQQFAGTVGESSITWTGYDAAVRAAAYGQLATAAVAVRDTSVEIHVVLPTLLTPLGGTIESFLGKTAASTLR